MKPRFPLFGMLILAAGLSAPPALAAAEGPAPGIEISIRYFDKQIYHVEEKPIWVQVTITNNGTAAYRFKIAEDKAFSVDFDVRTLSNRPVESAEYLIRKRTSNEHVYFREVSLEIGESFSFVEDVRRYANLDRSGAFVVRAKLHPALVRAPATGVRTDEPPLVSGNSLSLDIRPTTIPGPDGLPLQLDQETNAVLVRGNLPPDEVVRYTLEARQKTQWEKFFLYLDLEAMISRNPSRGRQWQAESDEGRRRMVARYREELQSAVIERDIATIPVEFEIEQTSYGAQSGTVTVLEKFKPIEGIQSAKYLEKKRYTYYLRRKDNVWTIVDYMVLNLGTE